MISNEFIVPMEYCYKGSTNISLRLTKNSFGNMEVRTSYGEFVGVYADGNALAKVMFDLANGKYAE